MQDKIYNNIKTELEAIMSLMREYTAQGAYLLSCENDSEINETIAARNGIIEKLTVRRAALDDCIRLCSADEAEFIRRSMSNKTYSGHASAQLVSVREQISALRSLQLAAVEKDKLAHARLSARFEDIKLKLEELKDDKKKIDFYAKSSGGNGVGLSLDSHS